LGQRIVPSLSACWRHLSAHADVCSSVSASSRCFPGLGLTDRLMACLLQALLLLGLPRLQRRRVAATASKNGSTDTSVPFSLPLSTPMSSIYTSVPTSQLDSTSMPTSVPIFELDADRDVVINEIQGYNASRSSGVSPGQAAVIALVLAIGLVILRRTLLSRSTSTSGSVASGWLPLLPDVAACSTGSNCTFLANQPCQCSRCRRLDGLHVPLLKLSIDDDISCKKCTLQEKTLLHIEVDRSTIDRHLIKPRS
jgi:hypothetical protein